MGDHEVAVTQFGTGPDLVMIPPPMMCMSMWHNPVLAELSPHFRITLFDLPGTGESPGDWSVHGFGVNSTARLTADLVATLDLDRVVLLGKGSGAAAALLCSIAEPTRIAGVVAVSAVPGGPHTVHSEDVPHLMECGCVDDLTRMMFPPDHDEALVSFSSDFHSRRHLGLSASAMRAQAASWREWIGTGMWDELPSIPVPVLVISGEADAIVDVQNSLNLASRVPESRLLTVPECGYAVLIQETELCTAAITEFAQSLPGSTA